MKLSLVIPVYKERETIKEVIKRVSALPIEKEIIIVDDGLIDGTRELLKKLMGSMEYSNLKILFHEINMGKGSAIRSALEVASGDLICIQDVDLEYEPFEILELIKRFEDNSVDAVYGSRLLKYNPVIYKRYLWGNKFITFLINLLYNSNYTDTYTYYKLIRKDVMKSLRLQSKRFEIEAEISIKLAKNKKKVVEMPISYIPRSIKAGKKIKFKDAVKGILQIIKYKFR